MVICVLKCMAKVVMPLIPFKGQAWDLNGEVSVLDETFWNRMCKEMKANFFQWTWPQHFYPLSNDRGVLCGESTWEQSKRCLVRNIVTSFMYLNVSVCLRYSQYLSPGLANSLREGGLFFFKDLMYYLFNNDTLFNLYRMQVILAKSGINILNFHILSAYSGFNKRDSREKVKISLKIQ